MESLARQRRLAPLLRFNLNQARGIWCSADFLFARSPMWGIRSESHDQILKSAFGMKFADFGSSPELFWSPVVWTGGSPSPFGGSKELGFKCPNQSKSLIKGARGNQTMPVEAPKVWRNFAFGLHKEYVCSKVRLQVNCNKNIESDSVLDCQRNAS